MAPRRLTQRWVEVALVLGVAIVAFVAWSINRKPSAPPADGASPSGSLSAPMTSGPALRVGVFSSCGSALVALARADGLFSKAGVKVDLIQFPNGRKALHALTVGNIDLAITGNLPFAQTILERDDLTAIASLGRLHFDRWVVTKPGISGPNDLKGKRIGVQKSIGGHYILDKFLADAGLTANDVEIVDISEEEMKRALASGRVDGLVVAQPFMSSSKERFGQDVEELQAPGLFDISFLLVARKALLDAQKEALTRMLRQLAAAENTWRSDQAKATDRIADELLTPHPKMLAECSKMSVTLGLDQPLVEEIDKELVWFEAHGKMAGKKMPPAKTFFSPDLLRTVDPRRVPGL